MTSHELKQILAAAIPCSHLSVDGDGHHWFATIVSSAFEGMRRVARHQLVYRALGGRIESDEVHALSMQTLTPAEWDASKA